MTGLPVLGRGHEERKEPEDVKAIRLLWALLGLQQVALMELLLHMMHWLLKAMHSERMHQPLRWLWPRP